MRGGCGLGREHIQRKTACSLVEGEEIFFCSVFVPVCLYLDLFSISVLPVSMFTLY